MNQILLDQSYTLINALPYPIVVLDSSLKPIFCNATYTDFLALFASDFTEKIQQTLKQNPSSLNNSFTLTSKANQRFRCSCHSQQINNETMFIVSIDTEETSFSQLKELREGFLRTVSHELRTPLTTVMGFIELVYFSKESTLTDQQKSYLKTALNEAKSLKTLIDDLLDFTILKSRKTTLDMSPIYVEPFLESIIEGLTPIIAEKNIRLVHTITNTQLTLTADKKKLKRIFINLISNALKFTESGSITLHASLKPNHIIFSVEDTGIGINEEEQKHIFNEFTQTDYSTTRQFEGLGLGLAIVKQLVELHGGTVWVKSSVGEGSTFYFSIPT